MALKLHVTCVSPYTIWYLWYMVTHISLICVYTNVGWYKDS